jgi:cell division protein ZapE
MVEAGAISYDPAQALAAEKLELLANRLARYAPPGRTDILSYFTRKAGALPQGLYLYGGVGRGKTMLMDLFCETVPVKSKRRQHFHAFMAEVHERIAEVRKTEAGDPMPAVARDIARQSHLLCLDELHVTDIADAMILGRLFAGLFGAGTVMVATSNVHPAELYKDGLNRQLFVPFIELIEDHMEVLELTAARDYRLDKLDGHTLYFVPADEAAETAMRAAWRRLTGTEHGAAAELIVKGRHVAVPEAHLGVARFRFEDLCGQPLGAGDYLAIAQAFHTVLIEAIPRMGPERRNEARRFITLIDTLYDRRVRLIASAEAEPEALYVAGDGSDLFARTASRLVEMRSAEYLSATRP